MQRFLLILSCLVSVAAGGQDFPVVALTTPDARLEAEFTRIASVRELSDGRVIISDPRDRGIVVADLTRGRTDPLSRKGQGPGEYSMVFPVRPISGDSSIMFSVDRRWLLFDGTNNVVTMPPDSPVILATRGFAIGADSLGNVITVAAEPGAPRSRDIGKSDSTTVIRVSRRSARVDTVAYVRRAPVHIRVRTDQRGRVIGMTATEPPLAVGEVYLLFRDGWLAVARLEPYRVDWRSPDGHWVLGKPLPLPVVRLSAAEKRAYIDRVVSSWKRVGQTPDTISEWPEFLPPYAAGGMIEGPHGLLLIPKQNSAGDTETRYDVVDRRGRLVGQVTMPGTRRIVGSGASALYVADKDENDIEHLWRFAWPATLRTVP